MPVRVKSSTALPFGLPPPPHGWAQKRPGISLCMIVRDEERFLERCLSSVKDVVDEIVVVDTGSTDRTIDIARSFGATVVQREWRDDFAWARNESLKLARYRWVLQLDADEELLEESKEALRGIKTAPAHVTGCFVRCINRSDQYLGDVGTLSHAVVRLFPNHERIRFCGAIHEFPRLDDRPTCIRAVGTPIKIVHHGYMSDVVRDRSKFDRNMAIIEASVQANPGDPFNWYNLGLTAHLAGEHQRAAEGLARMWEISQEAGIRPFVPNGLSILADVLTDYLDRPEEALEYVREALKLAPRYGNAHFSGGRALEAMKRYEEAREMYLAAIDDGAHVDMQFVVDEDVPLWKAHNMLGGTYLAQGDPESGLRWFEQGLKNNPNVQPLRINRATALERLGRLDEAKEALRALCEELGDEQSVLQYVNFLLRHEPLEAIAAIERLHVKCRDEVARAQLIAAAAVSQRCGVGDGEAYLLKAREIAPGSADVLGPLETIYRSRGDHAAIARLRAAEAQTQPQVAADFARRAQIAASEGDFTRALAIAQDGLALAPSDAMLRYTAALACANLNRKPEALEHVESIREVTADLHIPVEQLRSVLLRDLGRPQDALAVVDRLLESRGAQIDALLLRASLLEALGRNQEAESVFQSALPLGKRRVAAELGAFYLRAGRFADAQRVAEEALA